MHNASKHGCAGRETADRRHSFPDFENPVCRHRDVSDRGRQLFQRVDVAGGDSFIASYPAGDYRGSDGRDVDVRQQAYKAGYKEGLEMGRRTAEARLLSLIEELQKALEDVNRLGRQVYAAAEVQTVNLAMAVARKIIGRQAAVDHRVVAHALRRALEGLARGVAVTVVLNPEDMAFVKTLSPGDIFDSDEEKKKIDFETDPAMAPGGCLVRTAAGDRDASIDGQMDRIAAAFEEALQHAVHESAVPERSDDT